MKRKKLNVQNVGANLSQVKLHLDWCSRKAAKYAVEHWHYSKSLPGADLVKIGVWEDDKFIGCVIFSRGANLHIGSSYNLTKFQAVELTRVALNNHVTPVTKIISIALKMLKKELNKIRLIISYADGNQNHLGVIYQAGNWIYEGEFSNELGIKLNGKIIHRRSINSKYGTSKLEWLKNNIDKKAKAIKGKYKHKYLYPLDEQMKKQIAKLNKCYPKCATGVNRSTSIHQIEGGGAVPTVAL